MVESQENLRPLGLFIEVIRVKGLAHGHQRGKGGVITVG